MQIEDFEWNVVETSANGNIGFSYGLYDANESFSYHIKIPKNAWAPEPTWKDGNGDRFHEVKHIDNVWADWAANVKNKPAKYEVTERDFLNADQRFSSWMISTLFHAESEG